MQNSQKHDPPTTHSLPDLDSRDAIWDFVRAFYEGLLADPLLGPLFTEVAAVDLDQHMPHIVDYWSKLLLGETAYQRHTMNIHRRLHEKRALEDRDFERWLATFIETVNQGWQGPKAERAKLIAARIASNMQSALGSPD